MTIAGRVSAGARAGSDPVGFFDAAHASFSRAAVRVGARDHDVAVAGARVRLRFAGSALVPALLPALEHLRISARRGEAAQLTVCCFDSASTAETMPAPAWGPHDYRPKGEIVGFNDDRIRTVFQPGIDILHLYDATRRVALYWVATPAIVPWWEASFPFRTIVHWWTAPTPLQAVHAGAVGRDGRGVLVAGNSGAGKSTTTLACLEAGLDYVGDDYVLVDVESAIVHSLYATAKLEPDNLARFPTLAPLVANADRLGDEKAMVFLSEHRPDQLCAELRLRAIVLPRVTGERASRCERASPAAALRALAPTTSFHLPGYGREVFAKVSALVRSVPCYHLHAGTDLDALAATVARLAVL
jgi:hypothetical protein